VLGARDRKGQTLITLVWLAACGVTGRTVLDQKTAKLHLESDPRYFARNPVADVRRFLLWPRRQTFRFSHGLHEAIRHNLGLINRAFRASAEASNAFLRLLRRRGRVAHVLRLMHQVGFPGALFCPSLARISLPYPTRPLSPTYTIDEHTLKVIEALDELNNSEDSRRAQFTRGSLMRSMTARCFISRCCLHDIGKGQG